MGEEVVILETYSGNNPTKRKIVNGINNLKLKGALKFEDLGANFKIEDLPRLSLEDLKMVSDMVKSGIMRFEDKMVDCYEDILNYIFSYNIYDNKEFVYLLKDHIRWSKTYFEYVDDLDKFGSSINYHLWILENFPISEKQIKTAIKNDWVYDIDLFHIKLSKYEKYTKTFLNKYKGYLFKDPDNIELISSKALELFDIDYILDNLNIFNMSVILSENYTENYGKSFKQLCMRLTRYRTEIDFQFYRLVAFINNLNSAKLDYVEQLGIINNTVSRYLRPYAMTLVFNKYRNLDRNFIYEILNLEPYLELFFELVYGMRFNRRMLDYHKAYTTKALFGREIKFSIEPIEVVLDSSEINNLGDFAKLASMPRYKDMHIVEFDKTMTYSIDDIINIMKTKHYDLRYIVYMALIERFRSYSPTVCLSNGGTKHISSAGI